MNCDDGGLVRLGHLRTALQMVKENLQGGVAGKVTSFNNRTGDIAPQTGDYSPAMVGLEPITNTQIEEILK